MTAKDRKKNKGLKDAGYQSVDVSPEAKQAKPIPIPPRIKLSTLVNIVEQQEAAKADGILIVSLKAGDIVSIEGYRQGFVVVPSPSNAIEAESAGTNGADNLSPQEEPGADDVPKSGGANANI